MPMTRSATSIRTLVKQHFKLTITDVIPLAGEVDLNYRLSTTEGDQLTLKISAPGADPQAIGFEAAIMNFLAEQQLSVTTPVPLGATVTLSDGSLMRLQTWVPGKPLGEVAPITSQLRKQWGMIVGELTKALAGFQHPHAPQSYKWNPSQTLDVRPLQKYMTAEQQTLANHFWDRFEATTYPVLHQFPVSINYNDAHWDNLLVGTDGQISGLIDFGDAMQTHTINELAIACAYAGMHVPDPLGAMSEVISGFSLPLSALECDHLLNFITGRMLITVAVAAENATLYPENAYLQVSAAPAWALLEKLRLIPPALAAAHFRVAAGLSAHPNASRFNTWASTATFSPVVKLADRKVIAMDFSVGSLDLGNHSNFTELAAFTRHVSRWLEDRDAAFGVGGYGEMRPVYTTDDFATEGNNGPRWRTTHLGIDVWGPAKTAVYAPYPGRVHSIGTDPTKGGYGAVIILEHATDQGLPFYTLYGHLSAASIKALRAGAQVQSGDLIATFGDIEENGGWPPHLHFQVMLETLNFSGDYPGVAYPEERDVWLGLCPDPHPFLPELSQQVKDQLMPVVTEDREQTKRKLGSRRGSKLGYSLSVSYQRPLHIVRGAGQFLYNTTGRRFLDTVNNVAHVGHEHPEVVRALQRQSAVLNTNSRYLHEGIVSFAEALTATLPDALSVVHFVNSGSEANELALRMCEAWSGTRNMLAVEVGYHGNTGRTIDVSSYKFDGKGGVGAPPQTTIVPMPDTFRGRHRDSGTAAKDYANYLHAAIQRAENAGERFGGFICESILSCGGQVVLPDGYLKEAYQAVRTHGGLCIADEVQVGLGRVGSHWWGFELQGVVPDIVTIGKPLGNGHPLGAVVCTPEVAANFANGMEYFNTFGGNPVSCAVGQAVLRTVREEGLREQAQATGQYLKTLLTELQGTHSIIGDVRGEGLFLGFELVEPDLAPATAPAKYLKNRMRHLGFLMSTDGPHENVIKIKPPMCFTRKNAQQLVHYLDRVFREDPLRSY